MFTIPTRLIKESIQSNIKFSYCINVDRVARETLIRQEIKLDVSKLVVTG